MSSFLSKKRVIQMGTDLTTETPRSAMLKQMRPSSEQLESDDLAKHRSLICFELERVSVKVDRFGWSQMSARMKDALTEDWGDALDAYRLKEVKDALAWMLGASPKHCTNEQQVKKVIEKERTRRLALLPKEPENNPLIKNEGNIASAEFRADEMRRIGFSGAVRLRKFTDAHKT